MDLQAEINKLMGEEKYQDVINLLTTYLLGQPSDYRAIALRAVAYRKIRDHQSSVNELKKALEIAPNDANVYSEMGVSLFHAKQINEALVMMDKAVKIEPENPYRYSSRAYIKDALKDIDGAIADYEKAVELDPDDAIALNNLGMLQEKKGKIKESKQSFAKSDELQGIDWDEVKKRMQISDNGGTSVKDKKEAQSEIKFTAEPKSFWSVFLGIFKSKKEFKAFVDFVKNGFKLKQKSE
jgi:Tfp pilus assembly protein PilF